MDALSRAYRARTQEVQSQALLDLLKLWGLLDFANLDESFEAWATSTAALIQRDRAVVAGVAADYLRAERLAQEVSGAPRIALANRAPAAQISASLTATALAGYRTALRYRPSEQAKRVALVKTAGAVSRLVLDGGRATITDSLRLDPKGTGWMRVTSPSACGFCRMLEGRGAVYSAETARFSAHDHCKCSARPVYGSTTSEVLPFEPSKRNRSAETRAKDNARARDYIANVL